MAPCRGGDGAGRAGGGAAPAARLDLVQLNSALNECRDNAGTF